LEKTLPLTSTQAADILVQQALPGNLGPDDVSPDTFPLPNLSTRLIEASETVHDGRGFVVLRGLQPIKYSNFDNILLYLGVTSHIAEKRGMQDFDGRMIREFDFPAHQSVMYYRRSPDTSKSISRPSSKTSRNTAPCPIRPMSLEHRYVQSPPVSQYQPSTLADCKKPFHTDLCDILSLYALNTAAYGGESFLASSAKIYNELASTRPDIIEVLAKEDWVFDECVPLSSTNPSGTRY
jgi:hypothetical protein